MADIAIKKKNNVYLTVQSDPSISLNHYGHFCFQGNPEAIISFGPQPEEKREEILTLDLPE